MITFHNRRFQISIEKKMNNHNIDEGGSRFCYISYEQLACSTFHSTQILTRPPNKTCSAWYYHYYYHHHYSVRRTTEGHISSPSGSTLVPPQCFGNTAGSMSFSSTSFQPILRKMWILLVVAEPRKGLISAYAV